MQNERKKKRNSQAHIEPWMLYRMVQYYIENCGTPTVQYCIYCKLIFF